MKKLADIKAFKYTLPYASEIFGVYQPLLGWKSQRILNRVSAGYHLDKVAVIGSVLALYKGHYQLNLSESRSFANIAALDVGKLVARSYTFDASLLTELEKELPERTAMTPERWRQLVNRDTLTRVLNTTIKDNLARSMTRETARKALPVRADATPDDRVELLKQKLNRESVAAGVLLDLVNNDHYEILEQLFYKPTVNVSAVLKKLKYEDPFEYMDPTKDLDRVGLSPIGVVHLFRQYFFEFDTFLGTPVGHVWLSPGSTVELIEISTRRTVTERSLELQSERITKTESSLTEQDELSDAVKEDNKNEIKFGANVTANENWIWGSASQSASFDMNSTQQTAREQTHKHMRQQSQKLSTEIRNNYKSTFKTVTEVTDTTSKRYVLMNHTEKLINYELRRKMRQVGVQVQDIGTYLCWQAYVDEPGRDLGVGQLVHVAKSPDTDQIRHPEEIVAQKPFTEKLNIPIPFVGIDTDDNDNAYTAGRETEVGVLDDTEHIEYRFPQKAICKEANYYLDEVVLQPQGTDAKLSVTDFVKNTASNEASFTVNLDYVHFHGQNSINIEATLYWKPNQDETAIKTENEKKLAQYTERLEAAYRKEFVDAAKDRIKVASNIKPRKYEDLREEERIVVYRRLIQDLLAPEGKVLQPDYRTRHVVSELISSIFDVDKMLYFVAPEWWKPRKRYHQTFGTLRPTGQVGSDGQPVMKPDLTRTLSAENVVGWGGVNEMRDDNYYITDESLPAKLGSSLGWLLQLDGDNLRNAFLNAPWVKAVMPVRPGKEKAALNWLKQIEGVNGITDDDLYTGQEPELQGRSMLEVLNILADKVQQKHAAAARTSQIPDPDQPGDVENTVTATPVDRVYEHGFYPLQGGFKANVGSDFEIFDQWVEILPTDQVVAVEVTYDPRSGRQVPPA